jgi:hypothetical protein
VVLGNTKATRRGMASTEIALCFIAWPWRASLFSYLVSKDTTGQGTATASSIRRQRLPEERAYENGVKPTHFTFLTREAGMEAPSFRLLELGRGTGSNLHISHSERERRECRSRHPDCLRIFSRHHIRLNAEMSEVSRELVRVAGGPPPDPRHFSRWASSMVVSEVCRDDGCSGKVLRRVSAGTAGALRSRLGLILHSHAAGVRRKMSGFQGQSP